MGRGYSRRLAAAARSAASSEVSGTAEVPSTGRTGGPSTGVTAAPSTAGETAPATSVAAGVASPIPEERRLETTIAATMMITAPSATPVRRPTLLLYFTTLVAISSEP